MVPPRERDERPGLGAAELAHAASEGGQEDGDARRGLRPRPTISAVLITQDEEARLAAALASVRWADEIVIVDSGSTDATPEIANRFGARFVVRTDWPGFGPQKQRALDLATGDWIVSLDADEVVSDELRAAIQTAIAAPGAAAGFRVERHSFYLGHWFGRTGWRRDRVLRVFRRGSARFSDARIHERVSVDGPVRLLRGPLLHHTYRDIAHHIEKMNRYTTDMAAARFARGRRSGVLSPVLRAGAQFVKSYLLRGGFLDGRAGFLNAALGGVYLFLRQAKLWELGVGPAGTGSASAAQRRDAESGGGGNSA